MFCRRPITRSLLKPSLIKSLPPPPGVSPWKPIPCSSVPCRQYSSHRPNYHRFGETRDLWSTSQQFRVGVTLVSDCVVVWIGSNMGRAPVTGRWRFVCVSEEYEAELGRTSYQHVMQEYHDQILRPDDPRHKMVGRVLERLLPNSGLKGDVEFHVIDDDEELNAFVIPG
ncbi:MAG: hypothetical protein L6R42_007607 [Xanthoria sp. 1 TBL-2021]|nr:MAG: hypothetical protein L6R42_007607 [Xanthoria sp. 1 TBL-2021]